MENLKENKTRQELEIENRELKAELKEVKKREMEAVARYKRVADELLMYYTNFGKEKKKK